MTKIPSSRPAKQETRGSSPFALRKLDQLLAPWMPWLVVVFAVAVRLFRLDAQSLWADEGNSAALVARSFSEISLAAAADIHPPLYYWLLKFWTSIFGVSEIGLRCFSVVLSVASVALIYALGTRLFGRVAGLLAAFLLAISPFSVYYAQEARMYALLSFFATALIAAFVSFWQDETRELQPGRREPPLVGTTAGFLYAVVAILGLYTHYLFPVMLVVVNVLYGGWLLATWRLPFRAVRVARWIFLHVVIGIGYWAWLGIALERVRAWPNSGAVEQGIGALFQNFRAAWFGSSADAVPEIWLIVAAVVVLLGLAPLGVRAVGPQRVTRLVGWAVPALWLVAPFVFMWAFGLFKPAYTKFLLVASPACALIFARGVLLPLSLSRQHFARAGRWLAVGWLTVGLVGISVGSVISLRAYFFDAAYARDDYRGIVTYLNAVATPTDLVLLNAPGQQDVFGFYNSQNLPVLALPQTRPLDVQATETPLQTETRGRRRVYALFWATDESDPQRVVETWLDRHAFKVEDVWRGNVRFVTYSMPQAPTALRAVNFPFAPLTRLVGAGLNSITLAPGDVLDVTLTWLVEQTTSTRYKVFLQLLDANNFVWAQRDAEPAGESRPTSSWQNGERVEDRHGLLVPFGTPPGSYRLIVGLYDATTGARLKTAQHDFADLASVTVSQPSQIPPRQAFLITTPDDFAFETIKLIGHHAYPRGYSHAPATPLHRGDWLHVDLFWLATQSSSKNWQAVVALTDASGKQVANTRFALGGPSFPTSQWRVDEIVRSQTDLFLPQELSTGTYHVEIALALPDQQPAPPFFIDSIAVH